MKLFPSGSKDLKTRRATSDGVSFDTKAFSWLNNTGNEKHYKIIEFNRGLLIDDML